MHIENLGPRVVQLAFNPSDADRREDGSVDIHCTTDASGLHISLPASVAAELPTEGSTLVISGNSTLALTVNDDCSLSAVETLLATSLVVQPYLWGLAPSVTHPISA